MKKTIIFILILVAIFGAILQYEESRIHNLYEVINLREDSVAEYQVRTHDLEKKLEKLRNENENLKKEIERISD